MRPLRRYAPYPMNWVLRSLLLSAASVSAPVGCANDVVLGEHTTTGDPVRESATTGTDVTTAQPTQTASTAHFPMFRDGGNFGGNHPDYGRPNDERGDRPWAADSGLDAGWLPDGAVWKPREERLPDESSDVFLPRPANSTDNGTDFTRSNETPPIGSVGGLSERDK
jgi:hypothetical protein